MWKENQTDDSEIVKGLSGTYVDDLLCVGTSKFKEVASKTTRTFDMGDDEELPCSFTGFQLSRNEDVWLVMDQTTYLEAIKPISEEAEFSDFASLRMKLAWISHTKPDCAFEGSQLAQVTQEHLFKEKIKAIKRINRVF